MGTWLERAHNRTILLREIGWGNQAEYLRFYSCCGEKEIRLQAQISLIVRS